MVTVVDPHIKKDDNYPVYSQARDNSFFIKKADGVTDYEGHCWPGAAMWLDFVNPTVRDFWAYKFALDEYQGTTEHVCKFTKEFMPNIADFHLE